MRIFALMVLLTAAVIIGSQQATDFAAVLVGMPFGIVAALLWVSRRPSFDVCQIETGHVDMVLLPPVEVAQ